MCFLPQVFILVQIEKMSKVMHFLETLFVCIQEIWLNTYLTIFLKDLLIIAMNFNCSWNSYVNGNILEGSIWYSMSKFFIVLHRKLTIHYKNKIRGFWYLLKLALKSLVKVGFVFINFFFLKWEVTWCRKIG